MGRSDKRTSVKTGVCPDGPIGQGHLLIGRNNKRTSVETGVRLNCPDPAAQLEEGTFSEGETTEGHQSKPVFALSQREKPHKSICQNWCLPRLLSPRRPSGKRAPSQRAKQQKDFSQNRSSHLLRGRRHKSSSVKAGVCLAFPPFDCPIGK